MASSSFNHEGSWAQTVGALLLTASDPWSAAALLKAHLTAPTIHTERALAEIGVAPQLADDFRAILPTNNEDLARACALGAAWEAGRRSSPPAGQWSPVATWVGGAKGFEHRTAESLISLIIRARSRIRLFAPFVDEAGLGAIASALAAATSRRVVIDLAHRVQTTAVVRDVVAATVAEKGSPKLLRLRPLLANDNFPHLKMLTIDGAAAYIGSANLTWAALVHNIELGVLVDGPAVAALDRLFDLMVEPPMADESRT
jgi:phosphatidylserine/phosphatidylglycerophosphate/cardiolipin synthase-like enzyme